MVEVIHQSLPDLEFDSFQGNRSLQKCTEFFLIILIILVKSVMNKSSSFLFTYSEFASVSQLMSTQTNFRNILHLCLFNLL